MRPADRAILDSHLQIVPLNLVAEMMGKISYANIIDI